ncbi:hypothetical protein ACIBUR_04005 [Streptomyces anulatus]
MEAVEAARTGSPEVTPRRLLQMATLDGAHDLGLGDVTGSITSRPEEFEARHYRSLATTNTA